MLFLFVLVVFLSSFLLSAAAVMAAAHFLGKTDRDDRLPDESDGLAILKMDQLSSIAIWGKLLNRFDFVERMRTRLAEADMDWSVGRLTALMLLVGAFVTALISGLNWLPFSGALLMGCGAALAPYGYVLRRRAKRFEVFEKQFPDALDFLSRSMRAGHPLPVALEMLSSEEPPPLAVEMRKTAEERKLGMQLDRALDNLATRVPLISVRVFVAAVKLQSRTGGRLSEVLGGLAETMREGAAIEGEVKALAAHGRVTGAVLTALPVGIGALMAYTNPGYLNIIVETPTGRIITASCLAALVLAHFVIRKIVDIRL